MKYYNPVLGQDIVAAVAYNPINWFDVAKSWKKGGRI